MDADIVQIDPRLIVNSYGARPVTSYHVNRMKDVFRKNGYVSGSLITCRFPTAREISAFYREAPHCLSATDAEKRAQEVLKKPGGSGHFYCIDGLHRTKVALELIEEKAFQEGFRLFGRVVKDLGKEYEIALSISLNSSNDYCIKLSACALVLQCSKYDEIVNNNGRKKTFSAAEVARRMVQCGGTDKSLSDKTVGAMAETRRQVIGISRKLPSLALQYLEEVQSTNPTDAESAFTISNLKAVPKPLAPEVAVSLLKRLHHFYKTQIPNPKAMAPNQVKGTCFYASRAIKAVEKFMNLCEYSRLPAELEHIADQMKNTNKHDQALSDFSYEGDVLYEDIVQECEKKVPGGAAKIMIARRKILSNRRGYTGNGNHCPKDVCSYEESAETDKECGVASAVEDEQNSKYPPENNTSNFDVRAKFKNYSKISLSRHKPKLIPVSKDQEISDQGTISDPLRRSDSKSVSVDNLVDDLPPGWLLFQSSFQDFSRNHKEWNDVVETCADFVIFDLDKSEKNQDNIDAIVRHVGAALRVTGACHAFCTIAQFSKILESAGKLGLLTISTPLIYVADASKTRRLTYTLQPQDICEYAAVFFKPSTKRGEKHYFSAEQEYDHSTTPAWTNVTSNILPSRSRLLYANGTACRGAERSKELYKHILRQWCRPGGLCYHLFAGSMSVGLAAYELGIKYVAIEEEKQCYIEAKIDS